MKAAICSASAASVTSSTFSAFCSPERERLKEPTKTTSSATVTLACMKSWTVSGLHGVEGFPENGSRESTVASSGIFQAPLSECHCSKTRSVWGSSTTPAASTPPPLPISASAPSIGAEVITGEAIRTRDARRLDRLGDPRRERLAVPGGEPGPHRRAADVERGRLGEAAALHLPPPPQLLEVLAEALRHGGRGDGDHGVLLPGPGVDASSWSSRSRPPRSRGPRTCGASGRGCPGSRVRRSAARRGSRAWSPAAGGSPAAGRCRCCRGGGYRTPRFAAARRASATIEPVGSGSRTS